MKKLYIVMIMIFSLIMCPTSYADSNVNDTSEMIMTCEEYHMFEEIVWDSYINNYCVNECDECDSYYYKECMCDSCENGTDCYECLNKDFYIFIDDYYEEIMDLSDEILLDIQNIIQERNEEPLVYYEL